MRFAKLGLTVLTCPMIGCGSGSGQGGVINNPPANVSSLVLSRTTLALKPSESATITATPKDVSGRALTGRTITWAVAPSSGVVSLSSTTGSPVTVTATNNGQADLSATVEQITAHAQISVQSTFSTSADVQVGGNGQNVFTPNSVDLAVGGTVNFNWAGDTHNVTFENPPAGVTNITDRSSGTVSRTFGAAGVYNYSCTIHSGMSGVVAVH